MTEVPASGTRLIGRSIRRQRRRLTMGYPLIMAWQMCETFVPVAIGIMIDQAVSTGDTSNFLWCLLMFVALFAILSNSYRFGARIILRAQQEEAHSVRLEISEHVLDPRGAKTSLLPGETLSLATSDADLVSVVIRQLAFAIAAALALVLVAAYVLMVDLGLGLMILIGVPTVVTVIQAVTPLIAKRTSRQQESTAAATGLAADLVQGLRPLKGIGGEDVALDTYHRASVLARDNTISVARSWGYLSGLTTGLSGLLLAAVTVVAGIRALDGDITVGQLIALVGLTQFLAEPIAGLGDLSAQFAASRASANRIVTFLKTPTLVAEGSQAPQQARPQIRIEDLDLGNAEELTFATRDHELLALVIDDPAVSDGIVDLLAGHRSSATGQITLGDVPLADLSIAARRSHLLVNAHHTEIFAGTMRSVIDPGVTLTPAQLDEVLAASAANDVIALHPDGLDRAVQAGGLSLSGGQRQRLALARALAAHAPLLVLQDPTSAVDSVTEQSIADALYAARASVGATVVITSSPALLQRADRVLLIRDGRVAASGTHTELMHDAGYRETVLR